MLSARSTTEILSTKKNGCARILWHVERKLRVLLASRARRSLVKWIQVPKLIEQIRTETRSFYGFQKLFWDDHVSINVGTIQWDNQPNERLNASIRSPPRPLDE